jgi:septum formation protein
VTVTILPSPRLVLASRSPRRQELLREAGYQFDIDPADVDEESYPPSMLPADVALELARSKANKVSEAHQEDVVLGADTVVAFGDKVIGKPRDKQDARRILFLLAGTTHIVITGVAVVRRATGFFRNARVMSAVRMRPLTAGDVDKYIATGDWQGKAGAYGIQDKDPFVERISGDHTNIVGLPMKKTKELLSAAGVEPNPHT